MGPDPSNAIGVFDSGVGGLSVLQPIRAQLPAENLIYVADSAYAPYGNRSSSWIAARSRALSQFLVDKGAKAVVVACNTATTIAIAELRAAFPTLPVVAIEPAVKPAVHLSDTRVVAVMATTGTLASPQYANLLAQYGRDAEVIACPCPGLADLVEAGVLSGPDVAALLLRCLAHVRAKSVDVVALGCTHYTFLRDEIEAIWGESVTVLDPAPAVARELRRRLEMAGLLAAESAAGREAFYTSGDPGHVGNIISRLWATENVVLRLPEAAFVHE